MQAHLFRLSGQSRDSGRCEQAYGLQDPNFPVAGIIPLQTQAASRRVRFLLISSILRILEDDKEDDRSYQEACVSYGVCQRGRANLLRGVALDLQYSEAECPRLLEEEDRCPALILF